MRRFVNSLITLASGSMFLHAPLFPGLDLAAALATSRANTNLTLATALLISQQSGCGLF